MDRDWYDDALEAGAIGLWRWEVATDYAHFSKNVEGILGVPEGSFDGTFASYIGVAHEEDAAALKARIESIILPGGPARYELRHRVVGPGEPRWIEVRGRVHRDAEGRATALSGTIANIERVVGLEEAESARDAQLWAFIDALPGVALVLDEEGVYLDLFTCDDALLASSRESLLGRRMHDVLPEGEADRFLEIVRQVLTTRMPVSTKYPLVTPAGETWFEARVAPVVGGWSGRPAVVWIANDITERHRAEQGLRASETRYRSVVELLAEGVMVIGRDGSILASNPSADRILDSSPDGRGGRSALSPGRRITDRNGKPIPMEQLPLARAFAGEHVEAEVVGVEAADPSAPPRWISVSARPFRAADGMEAALISFVDVTEERWAMEALTESEWQLRSVIDNAEVMLWRLDGNGRVVFAGGRLLEKLGYQDALLVGEYAEEQLGEEELATDIVRALGGEEVRAERDLRGATLEVVHTPVRDAAGALTGVISVGVDVSERIRASRERERFVTELEAKNAELERFNYTVSHDLKSPLITIQGFVDLLEKDIAAERPDRVARDLDHIVKATARMQRLLDDLLELSRAGRMQRPEHVALAVVVDEALAQVEGVVRGRGVSIVVGEGLPEVYADRTRVLQVVQNLIDNAVKHLGEQPEPRVDIGAREDGTVFVKDNGRGVPERYQEMIFGLFERLDPSVPGTGVGLALARRIVDAHGGRIWVESSGVPGEGSTFCFTLPSARVPGLG